ncbi:MAG: homocysteine S-methyltransferase family protein, partial [Patescibacteria group bacterium]|nr:homocysteine S-methyltransferase family protein [Patescibacteria group bacterium]
KDGGVLLAGACGTEIQRRGVPTPLPLWSVHALLENPEVVKQIHLDYLAAGAEVITTNTFRTTARALAKAGIGEQARELTRLASRLAREAVSGVRLDRKVLVGGSIAPLEDCYEPSLVPPLDIAYQEHREQAQNFVGSGVDFIILETFNTIQEALAAYRAVREVGFEAVVSFVTGPDGNLLSGETIAEAVKVFEPENPLALCVNCIQLPITDIALQKLAESTKLPIGIYANGEGHPHDDQGWLFTDSTNPDEYVEYAKKWQRIGATIIGGCCGTTPTYIQKLKQELF